MKSLAHLFLTLLLPLAALAQVNSGSNGSDGALNPAGNLVIDMAGCRPLVILSLAKDL